MKHEQFKSMFKDTFNLYLKYKDINIFKDVQVGNEYDAEAKAIEKKYEDHEYVKTMMIIVTDQIRTLNGLPMKEGRDLAMLMQKDEVK